MYLLNNCHLHYLSITCDLTLSDMDQKIRMISHTVTANHAFYCWVSEGLPALSFHTNYNFYNSTCTVYNLVSCYSDDCIELQVIKLLTCPIIKYM